MIKTIILTGSEIAVKCSGRYFNIKNSGAGTMYASTAPNVVADADGVMPIDAGTSVVMDTSAVDTVYLFGTGKAVYISKDTDTDFFNSAAAAGGEDAVARAEIAAHESNAEIHVTAEDKAAWNGKAELSDIPATLPANGGNSDTVNGKTVQLAFFRGISGLNKAGIEIASTDTADAIWKAIPNESVFATETQYLTDASWNFPAGTNQHSVLIMKLSNNRLLGMYLYPKSGSNVFFANVDGNGSYAGNWRKICDGGDAATLAAHPASDFVLKSDFDALAERVAALEGGTTT